jgi:hypothetical protein
MKRTLRQKAQDVFNQSTHILGKKVSFAEAFPQIDDLEIEVEESEVWPVGERRFTRAYPPGEYINCSNHLCYNGGVRVGSLLRQMVDARRTEGELTQSCQGYEGSPRGRRHYRSCMHRFRVRVRLTYKP